MQKLIKSTALALAASSVALTAVPAQAQYRDRYENNRYEQNRYNNRYGNPYDSRYGNRYGYGEPVRRDTRVWRGRDGHYRCEKKDGTTGLIIGGAVGALLGREIDSRGDRTLGTILGGAAGALLGQQVTGGTRCR